MPEDTEGIELRSEEVQDILTKVPHWMIRWGNVIILIIIFLIFLFAYFIKYPDVVTGNIIITTQIPPEKLVAKTTGKIQHILVEDRTTVAKETPIAIIENSADYKDVYSLKDIIDSIDINMDKISFPLTKSTFLRLGDVESAYAVFEKEFLAYEINKEFQPYDIDKVSQSIEAREQKERLKLLIDQNNIALLEMEYKKKDLERHKNLFEQLRENDLVLVVRLDRLARSLKDLVFLIDEFAQRKVILQIGNLKLDFTTAEGRLYASLFGAVAQFERELIRERTLSGLKSAREKGRIGGKPKGLSELAKLVAISAYDLRLKDLTQEQILLASGIKSTRTLYKYLRFEAQRRSKLFNKEIAENGIDLLD